jgi:ribose transport system ATP-binding protein
MNLIESVPTTVPKYRVEMIAISKSFGGVHALRDVSLRVEPGQIYALVGENGAGKSTLMKILSGVVQKDKGEIRIDGRPALIPDPRTAKELGIGIIYQEFALAPDLSVVENIYISRLGGRFGLVHLKPLYAQAAELLGTLGLTIDPRARCGKLSVAYQQAVEIVKALSQNARILILDEPTAVLAPPEVKRLFGVLRQLKSQGVSIIYISHRLNEIFEIADIVTVLRDGLIAGTANPASSTMNEIISLMIGRRLESMYPPRRASIGGDVFRAEGIRWGGRLKDVSFRVRNGEVLGFAGLVGSGRTEMVRAIFGADPLQAGTILINGRRAQIRSPRDAVRAGLALVPEDRKAQGVLLLLEIRENISMTRLPILTAFLGFMRLKKAEAIAEDLIRQLAIKTTGPNVKVSQLSGGNQQKVALAKWFGEGTRSSVVFLDEPTRGVDVAAKVEIYKLVNDLAERGLGVVIISSEMIELIGMCDRVLVMHDGSLQGELLRDELTEENIMRLAVGNSGPDLSGTQDVSREE